MFRDIANYFIYNLPGSIDQMLSANTSQFGQGQCRVQKEPSFANP